jgi:hypothetical protein
MIAFEREARIPARCRHQPACRQHGAVLIVGLVMLAVMTLLVVSMIKTSVVELKIGGATQIAQQHFTNAEAMINGFLDANNGRFASNYLALPESSGGPRPPSSAPAAGTYNSTTQNYTVASHNVPGGFGQADVVVRQIQCSGQPITGTQMGAFEFVFFDIRSTATGNLGGSATVHQGIRSIVPAGSC